MKIINRYRVEVRAWERVYSVVEIDAETEADAKAIARRRAKAKSFGWHRFEAAEKKEIEVEFVAFDRELGQVEQEVTLETLLAISKKKARWTSEAE